MIGQVTNEALRSFVEIFGETNLGLDDLFEDFKRIIVHERASTDQHLVNENAQTVPINRLAMSLIHYDLRSKVLRSATNGVGSLSITYSFDKPKI